MKLTKKTIYVGLFAILYLIVAFSSFFHACAFFGLANNTWMSIILAFAFEVGQAAVLFSLLTSTKDRSRIMPWVLMSMFTLVQVIGNVYSSYKYIITNSVENLRYFKEPIFIWTELPDAQANVIIVYLVGALLPIAALLLTSMITNYLTDQSEENNTPILVPEITSEKGPENPPIELKDQNEFLNLYKGDSLLNQNSILHMENKGLIESNKKKESEIEQLKKQLEELKKNDEQRSESSTQEDKSNNDNGEQPVGTIESETKTESTNSEEGSQQKDNEISSESTVGTSGEDQKSETELEGNQSNDGKSNIEYSEEYKKILDEMPKDEFGNIIGTDMDDTSEELKGPKGPLGIVPEDYQKNKQQSHFINL